MIRRHRIEGSTAPTVAPRPLLSSGILIADRIARLVGNTVIVIWVARHFGPVDFGLFSYGQSMLVLVTAFATLGLPDVVVRELVRRPRSERLIVRTALALRVVGALIALALSCAFALIAEGGPTRTVLLVAILVASLFFQASEVFEYRLQAIHRIPVIAAIRATAFALCAALKVTILLSDGSILAIALATTLEAVIGAVLLTVHARSLHLFAPIRGSGVMARRLLAIGFPLFVRTAVIALSLRVDQLYVKYMVGIEALGSYAAAARLIDIWFFVPTAVMTAYAPLLSRHWVDDRERYYRVLTTIMAGLVYASAFGALAVSLLAPTFGGIVFGAKYPDTPVLLAVVVWSVVFGTIGQVTNSWIVNEGATRIALLQAVFSAAVALIAYPILIARFGTTGAAGGVVLVQAIINLGSNALFRQTRHIFRLQIGVLLLVPLRDGMLRRAVRR